MATTNLLKATRVDDRVRGVDYWAAGVGGKVKVIDDITTKTVDGT